MPWRLMYNSSTGFSCQLYEMHELRFVNFNVDFSYHCKCRDAIGELILGLRPANERRRYKVTASLIGWVQT